MLGYWQTFYLFIGWIIIFGYLLWLRLRCPDPSFVNNRQYISTMHDTTWSTIQLRSMTRLTRSRVTLYTAGHLHTAVPHCSHSRAPIVHTAVPRENNEHGCVYLRCRAVCKLPGCVEGHPWRLSRLLCNRMSLWQRHNFSLWNLTLMGTPIAVLYMSGFKVLVGTEYIVNL